MTDIRLKTADYTFDGVKMTLCINMNVLADVQEHFGGDISKALDGKRTTKANIAFLCAMVNDYLDSIGAAKRYTVREVGRLLPPTPDTLRELNDLVGGLLRSALMGEDEPKNP